MAANQHQADHNRERFDAWQLLCPQRDLKQSRRRENLPAGGHDTLLWASRLGWRAGRRMNTSRCPSASSCRCAGGADHHRSLPASRCGDGERPVCAQLPARLSPADLDLSLVGNVAPWFVAAEFEVGEHPQGGAASVSPKATTNRFSNPVMFREADCVLITRWICSYLLWRWSAFEEAHPCRPTLPQRCFQLSASSAFGLQALVPVAARSPVRGASTQALTWPDHPGWAVQGP